MTAKIILLNNITKKFQLFWEEIIVVENINLEIERNDLVLLYGPSGSGKTTLLNMIAGLLIPDEGEIQVAGLFLDLIAERERADFRSKYYGIVFQENNLISTLTAKENILLLQELIGGVEKSNEEQASTLLEKLGVEKRENSFPAQLSGGEKKRVGIARALVNNPYILLLDEPTGNLDQETAQQICELIQDLFLTTDMTIIISSHDPKLMDIATKIYKVEDHKVKFEKEYNERRKKDDMEYRPITTIELMDEQNLYDEYMLDEIMEKE